MKHLHTILYAFTNISIGYKRLTHLEWPCVHSVQHPDQMILTPDLESEQLKKTNTHSLLMDVYVSVCALSVSCYNI